MSYEVSEKRKKRERRGCGKGKDYKPYINPRELHGNSTTTALFDPVVGRQISLLSTGEKEVYLCLRWRDDVIDIREQYPLELKDTLYIASYYGIKHPTNMKTGEPCTMTSDLLVDYSDGHQEVFSVKYSRNDLTFREEEKLFIEKKYWENLGITFTLVFREDIDETYARNIGNVLKYWPTSEVHDHKSLIMHALAHKVIRIDMTLDPLPLQELTDLYFPKKMSSGDTTKLIKSGGVSHGQ